MPYPTKQYTQNKQKFNVFLKTYAYFATLLGDFRIQSHVCPRMPMDIAQYH